MNEKCCAKKNPKVMHSIWIINQLILWVNLWLSVFTFANKILRFFLLATFAEARIVIICIPSLPFGLVALANQFFSVIFAFCSCFDYVRHNFSSEILRWLRRNLVGNFMQIAFVSQGMFLSNAFSFFSLCGFEGFTWVSVLQFNLMASPQAFILQVCKFLAHCIFQFLTLWRLNRMKNLQIL